MKLNQFIVLVALLSILTASYAKNDTQYIFGRTEQVALLPENYQVMAKLDTGADMSSLNAIEQYLFKKDDQQWVKFTIYDQVNRKKYTLSRHIIRYVKIKNRKTNTKNEIKPSYRRPVVNINVCIGRHIKKIPVNLIDRSHFKYPLLLGWKTLKRFHALIDPSQNTLTKLKCHQD